MKLIHIASGDLWAGAEVQLFHLARELVKIPHVQLLVVLLNEGQLARELRMAGIETVIFDESKLSGIKILIKVIKMAGKFKPAIIHTHRRKENVIGGLVALLTRTSSVRTVHGANEFTNSKFNYKRLLSRYFDELIGKYIQKRIIAVSDEMAMKLNAIFPQKKITTIHNGINLQEIIAKSNEPIKQAYAEDQFNIAFVGRFVPVKRPDLFLEIASDVILKTPDKNIHFYMFGDGPLWREANEKIRNEDFQNRVHLTGFVENILPHLKEMDLLIFTSEHEGLPMTLLEAIALNVAVLSRNLATIKQVLCDGQCGYVLDTDVVDKYTQTIIELYNNGVGLKHKSLAAYESVRQHYSIENIATKYLQLYQSIIQDAG